jgi:hypothetical protein
MTFVGGHWLDSEHEFAIVTINKKGNVYDYLYWIYDNSRTANKIREAIQDGTLVLDEYQS